MNIRTEEKNGFKVAVVCDRDILISDTPSALDFMSTVQYETGCSRVSVYKEALSADFFILSTCLAGEILQKFTNYRIKFAIIGDFSKYTSKPLRDFIYESNRGNNIFFVSSEDEAVERLCGA